MVAILFNGAEPFEQIINNPSTEGPIVNLVKTGQAILYMYIAKEQGHITPGGTNF